MSPRSWFRRRGRRTHIAPEWRHLVPTPPPTSRDLLEQIAESDVRFLLAEMVRDEVDGQLAQRIAPRVAEILGKEA